jgi:TonB family protein
MSFIGDFQVQFPSRGAAFELSPAFQRRVRRHLDLPVAERRLTGKVGERSLRMTKAPALFVTENLRSTVAPRLGWIIAHSPALKRRAKLKRRSAAGRPSFQKLVKSDRTIRKCFAVLIFTLLAGKICDSGEAIASARHVEELTVVTTAAPVYPPIARAANVQGEVIVSVSVNAQGDVIAAQVLEGHVLLRKVAESAALKWKFNSLSQTSNTRVGQITFSFKFELEEAVEVKDDITFMPPGRLELIHKIPTIRPIQKVDGRIPEETCPLHGERMRPGLADISYGLPKGESSYPNDLAHIWQNIRQKIRRRFSYNEAARKYFPESNFWVGGGCMVGVENKAETLYCQSCRNAELNWRKKHPGKGIGFDSVISSVSN